MIEITDEMLKVARSMQSFELMIKRIIELHEQSKPKPEPVGYIYNHRLEQMLNSEVDNDCNFFPIKDDISRVIFNRNRDKYLALYTAPPTQTHYQELFGYFKAEPFGWTDCDKDDDGAIALYEAPPTREPLSDAEVYEIMRNTVNWLEYARAIEQAHGIGVTND